MPQKRQEFDKITVKAITVHQPWPHPIFYGVPHKDIENRGWLTPYRGWLAIHAGKKKVTKPYYEEFAEFYRSIGGDASTFPGRENLALGAILGVARVVACVKRHKSPWFGGKYGWVLEDPIALPKPIFINGQMSFWRIPPPDRKKLFDQIGDQMLAVERRL